MKKRALFLCALLLCGMSGCGDSGSSAENPEVSEEIAETETTSAQSDTMPEPETTVAETEEEIQSVTDNSKSTETEIANSADRIDFDYTQLHSLIGGEEYDSPFDFSRDELMDLLSDYGMSSKFELTTQEKYKEYDVYVYARYNSEDYIKKSNEKVGQLIVFYEKGDSIVRIIDYDRHNYFENLKNPYSIYSLLGAISSRIYRQMNEKKDALEEIYYTDIIYKQIETDDRRIEPHETRIGYDNTYGYAYEVSTTVLDFHDACLVVRKMKED